MLSDELLDTSGIARFECLDDAYVIGDRARRSIACAIVIRRIARTCMKTFLIVSISTGDFDSSSSGWGNAMFASEYSSCLVAGVDYPYSGKLCGKRATSAP